MSHIKERDIGLVKEKLSIIRISVDLLEEKYSNYFTKDDTELMSKMRAAIQAIDKELA